MTESNWLDRWDECVADGDNGAIEELWLARLEAGLGDGVTTAMEALRRLRSAGKKTLAATLLELAEAQAAGDGDAVARKGLLRELLRLGIGDQQAHRAALEECLRALWSDRPSLKALLQHFSLPTAKKPVEALDALETWLRFDVGQVVAMTGRGPGRVAEANPKLGVLRLDFEKQKRVPVPIDAAQKYLTPLPEGHFLRRRLEEPEALRRLAAEDPAGTLQQVLESSDGPLGVPEIKAMLDGIVAPEAWTSWWSRARKHPRLLASGKGTRVQYRLALAEGGQGVADEILREFERARFPEKVALARRQGTKDRELGAKLAEALVRQAPGQTRQPAVAWEAVILAGRLGAPGEAVEAAQGELVAAVGAAALLAAVGDTGQRVALLDFLRSHLPAVEWMGVFAGRMESEGHPRALETIAAALVGAGEGARVDTFLDQLILQPQKYPEAMVWASEDGHDAGVAALLEPRLTGALLVRLVDLAERSEFSGLKGRLKEVLSARGAAGRIVQERLAPEQGKRLLQILERPGEMVEERSWLRRSVTTRFPELRQQQGAAPLPALAGTVTRLQKELQRLLEKEIPDTLKAIQVAREHGDLRENFEYHAARARQEYLSARAADLQADLARVQVIDPALIDASVVRIGTVAALEPVDGGSARRVAVLGPYEADPDRDVLSLESEAAQALLEHAPGDRVEFDGRSWTVAGIENYHGGES